MNRTMVYVSSPLTGEICLFRLGPGGVLDSMGRKNIGEPVMPMAASPDRRFLYASLRGDRSGIASLAIEKSGELDLLSVIPSPAPLSYLSTDATGRFLLGASYADNMVCVLPIGRDGFVQAEPVFLEQSARNPHCIQVDPSNRFALAPNLGGDSVSQYLFDAATGVLTPNRPPILATATTSGPRHLCFSPNGRFVYLVTELSGEVLCLAFDPRSGTLTQKQALTVMPPGSSTKPGTYVPPLNSIPPGGEPMISAADIHITPDGRRLFVSERSSSTIACFAVDSLSGTLTYKGSLRTEAKPRDFAICPRGRCLVAAGEDSGHVSVYCLEHEDDLPRLAERYPSGGGPTWVEIVAL